MSDIGNRSIFGEISLVLQSQRTGTVRTLETSHVIVIPSVSFNRYMREPLLKKLNIII